MYIRPILRSAAVAAARGVLNVRPISAGARGCRGRQLCLQQLFLFVRPSVGFGAPISTNAFGESIRQTTPSPRGGPSTLRSWAGVRSMATADGGSVKELNTAQDVIDFWFGDQERFAKDEEYKKEQIGRWFGMVKDQAFTETQNAAKDLIEKASAGALTGRDWDTPHGALAKLVVLDQFPRTAYRGSAKAFENDEAAASLALDVISKGWDALDEKYTFAERMFVYMPLMHSERMEAQDVCVEKNTLLEKEKAEAMGTEPAEPSWAVEHRSVIAKFGRFPHRNAPLGRDSTPEEEEWLKSDDVPLWAKSQQSPSESK